MPRTENMELPQAEAAIGDQDKKATYDQEVKVLVERVHNLGDIMKELVVDDEVDKILAGLKMNNEGETKEKKLLKVIAALCDHSRHQKQIIKSVVWQQNVLQGQVMTLASQNDLRRKDRAGAFIPRRIQSEADFRIRSWNSEGDLTSTSQVFVQPLPSTTPSQHGAPAVKFDYWKSLEEMLKSHGVVEQPQMVMLLGIWKSKAGCGGHSSKVLWTKATRFLQGILSALGQSVGSADDASQLVTKVRQFLEKSPQGMTTSEVYGLILDSIPKEEWLTFARNELDISELDIAEVKSHSTPTEEQLRQMDLAHDAWNLAHTASE